MSLFTHLLQLLQLLLLIVPKSLYLSQIAFISSAIELIKDLALFEDHHLPVALFLLPLDIMIVARGVLLELHALSECFLGLLLGLVLLLLEGAHVLFAVVEQLVLVVLHGLDLRVEDELLADDFEAVLGLVLRPLLKPLAHVHVLLLEELYVLVRCLLVVEERADA